MNEKTIKTQRRSYVWSLRRRDKRAWSQAVAGEAEGLRWREMLRQLPFLPLCLLCSMGRMQGGASPFGMGLLAGWLMAGRSPLPAVLGCAAGAALGGSWDQAACILLFFLLHQGLAMMKVRPGELTLMLLCGLCAFLPVFAAESIYAVVTAALSALASMLLAVLFAGVLKVRWRQRESLSLEELCGAALLLGALLLGMKPWLIRGVSPALLLYLFVLLVGGYLGGPGAGAALGVSLGMLAALGEPAQPFLVGGMALCGLLCGLFGAYGRFPAALGLCLGGTLSAALSESWFAPAMWMQAGGACLLFLLLPGRLLRYLRIRVNRDAFARRTEADMQNEARQEVRAHLEGYAALYENMGAILRRRSGGRQYAAMARALSGMADALRRPVETDGELASACALALDKARLPVLKVRAWREGGQLRLRLRFRRRAGREQREEAVRVCAAAAGTPLRLQPGRTCPEDELLLGPASRFQLLVGAYRLAGEEGEPCGDNHVFRELPDDSYMLAISDGMGQGARAAEESRAAVELLEDYLCAGFEPQAAVLGVNDLLLKREKGEMFATMDLSLIDLTTGRLRSSKIGAAQSYIRRGRELIRLSGGALPMGIVEMVSPFEGETQLMDGDVLVMVSDGVADAGDEGPGWLEKEIGLSLPREPQAAARALVESAERRARTPDDRTALVARVLCRGGAGAETAENQSASILKNAG